MFTSFYFDGNFYAPFAVNHQNNILLPIPNFNGWSEAKNLSELKTNLSHIHPERDIERACGSILFEILCTHPLTLKNQSESYDIHFGKFNAE